MAEGGITSDEFPPDSNVVDPLLQRIAHKVNSEHLQKFSSTLLNLKDADYTRSVDGTESYSWERRFNVSTSKITLRV